MRRTVLDISRCPVCSMVCSRGYITLPSLFHMQILCPFCKCLWSCLNTDFYYCLLEAEFCTLVFQTHVSSSKPLKACETITFAYFVWKALARSSVCQSCILCFPQNYVGVAKKKLVGACNFRVTSSHANCERRKADVRGFCRTLNVSLPAEL